MNTSPWDYLILTASQRGPGVGLPRASLNSAPIWGSCRALATSWWSPTPAAAGWAAAEARWPACWKCCSREADRKSDASAAPQSWYETLRRLRILIIHAGGDSRRLPAYGPCGKIFVPLPGASDSALGTTLFDRQLPTYLALPPGGQGKGQIVITAGDVLLRFDAQEVESPGEGVCGLGCLARPEEASRHGVFCLVGNGRVRRFLQKPTAEVQAQERAITAYGQSVLDMGVFSFEAQTAVRLLELSDVRPNAAGALSLDWPDRPRHRGVRPGLLSGNRLRVWHGDNPGKLPGRRPLRRFPLGGCGPPPDLRGDARRSLPRTSRLAVPVPALRRQPADHHQRPAACPLRGRFYVRHRGPLAA